MAMKKLLALASILLGLACSQAQAQTTLPWGQSAPASASSNVQMRDGAGNWDTVGTLNNSTHQLIGFGIAGATIHSGSFPAGTPASPGVQCTSTTNIIITCTAAQATAQMSGLLLSQLATQAANTVVANTTGGAAAPTAVAAASNTLFGNYGSGLGFQTINGGVTCTNGLTYTNGTGFGCLGAASGTVTSIASGPGASAIQPNPTTTTGTVYAAAPAQVSSFRLTLTTGTPVLTANVAAATSIFLTPYNGNTILMHDGTVGDYLVSCAEMSNVLANSATGSAGPAAVAASGVYDLFAWNSGTFASPVCTLTRGPAWTNSTTRSAGTALSRSVGTLRNSVTITNGPAANFGTYVGTFVADSGGGTVSWNTGTAASGGGAALLDVWNMYNRVNALGNVTDSGVTYNYQSAAVRQARASAGNQVAAVIGQQEDAATCTYIASSSTAAAQGGLAVAVGIGINSTSTFSGSAAVMSEFVGGDAIASSATVTSQLAIGVSTLSANEQSQAVTAATFDLSATNNLNCGMRM